MLKDVAVHLDGSADDDIRIAHAQNLASRCRSHVTGVFTNPIVEYAYVLAVQSGLAPMEPIIENQEEMRKAGDRVISISARSLPNCRVRIAFSDLMSVLVRSYRASSL